MKILIVDDQQLFRSSFIRLLQSIYVTEVLYEEAADGVEALGKLKISSFDLVFLDISMPIMDGYETCKYIRQEYPNLPIIILTQFDDHHLIRHFHKVGVQSFLTKGTSLEDLTLALECVLNGSRFFPQEIKYIIENISNKDITSGQIELTLRERALIHLLHEGLTSKEIAQKLGLTVKSVHTYRERLLKKTNTNNSVELVSFGFKNGIISINSKQS